MKSPRFKVPKLSDLALTVLTSAVLTLTASQAGAQMLGVHFLGNGGPNGGTPAQNDPVTGTAGVVPIPRWNNITGTAYNGNITSSDGLTTATLNLTSTAGGFFSGISNTDGANASLLNGYIDAGPGTATATVSGLTSGRLFNIYIYTFGNSGAGGTRPGNNTANGLPNYAVNGTIYYTATTSGTGVNGFPGFTRGSTQSTQDTTNTGIFLPVTAGNYILIPNVSAVNGSISVVAEADTSSFRSGINGFELVAVVPEPSTVALLALGMGALVLFARRRLLASPVTTS